MRTRTRTLRHRIVSMLLALALACGLVAPSLLWPVSAAALDTIRVALYIFNRDTSTTVTLSSSSGLSIGMRAPDGVKPWFTLQADKSFRASLDQYMVKVLDTSDAAAAKAQYGKLIAAQKSAFLFSRNQGTKPTYQVYVGAYATKDEALSALKVLAGDSRLSISPNLAAAVGPHHWQAESYSTLAEASKQAGVYQDRGLAAYPVTLMGDNGSLTYAVWIGEETDEAALTAYKNKVLAAFPNAVLTPIDPTKEYLLQRSSQMDGYVGLPHYFYNGNGQKVWISSPNAGVKLAEKARLYRGSMELAQYNGKLALINELPFEQYLYGVVGAEMGTGWPIEALKAQAVSARTYALTAGVRYKIAHISDTVYDQAYKGMSVEKPDVVSSVDSTAGEVIKNKDGLIVPFYSSNAGGYTAMNDEVWGNPVSYLKNVPSPDDIASVNRAIWLRVVNTQGVYGYIRADLLKDTGRKNAAGLRIMTPTTNGTNIRPTASTNNDFSAPIAQANIGDELILVGQNVEHNAYSWIRGPFTAAAMLELINTKSKTALTGPLLTLEVSSRGTSGRVTGMLANGKAIAASYPDAFRSILGGLPSTRFEVEQTNLYTILGSNGQQVQSVKAEQPLYVLTGSGSSTAKPLPKSTIYLMNSNQEVAIATSEAQFRFHGTGFGHGLGMSQYGAKALAEQLGYDYKQILLYYYNGVSVIKD